MAGSPKGQQGLGNSPGQIKVGDGGVSRSGLNLIEDPTLGPHQSPGSRSGFLGEGSGGEGTPPPPRAWLGDTGSANSTETQNGNGNLLLATSPKVVEKPTPEPKATEEELEEGEIIDTSLEPE